MDSAAMVDLSLSINLNVNPPNNIDDHEPPIQMSEFQSDLVGDMKPSVKHENDRMVEELKRMNLENGRLTKMLTIVCEKYNTLQSHFTQLVQKDSTTPSPRKRKAEHDDNYENVEGSYTFDGDSYKRLKEIKTNVSRIFVRIDPSDKSLVVKDGYQWRKYGQKVTRDNPSPRAYYKCSFAPNCPVKKKVQKSVEDPSVLVAIYEGEHNHNSSPSDQTCKMSIGLNQNFLTASSPGPKSISSGHINYTKTNVPEVKEPLVQQFLIEEMASSLTRNPNFTAALAAAISNKVLDYDLIEGW